MLVLLQRRLRRAPVVTVGSYRRKLLVTASVLAVVVLLHVVAMMILESRSLFDAVWMTFTTITTVGYGDYTATTVAGRVATMTFLYALGVFLLANLAGFWLDFRSERRDNMLRGRWMWNMKDHIVILNAPTNRPEHFLRRLVQEIRDWKEFETIPIQIITEAFPDGLPQKLREHGVVHYHGDADDPEALEAANVHDAAYLLLFALSESDARADTTTLSIVERLHSMEVEGRLVLECVEARNRSRLLHFYPQATIVRPVRGYPEMLVRALVAPGTEQILENLFRREGVHSRRYDIQVRGLGWPEIVCRTVNKGWGTPLAYLDASGNVISCPFGNEAIDARALFLVVDSEHAPSDSQLHELLRA